MTGFEPATPTTPLWCATKLRYIPFPISWFPADCAGSVTFPQNPESASDREANFPSAQEAATAIWQARMVLRISMAMVMTPTPPGTGVIASHFSATASKSTSPTSR